VLTSSLAGVGGGIIGLLAAGQQARSLRRIGELNAKQREAEADDAKLRGLQEIGRLRLVTLSELGQVRAAAGGGMVDPSSGTALDMQSQILAFADIDTAFILEDAARESRALRFEADIIRFQSQSAAANAELAGFGQFIGSITSAGRNAAFLLR